MGFLAIAPTEFEPLLINELLALSAIDPTPGRGGVHFYGDLATAYRVCLWSRTASRILLPLINFSIASADNLYEAVRAFPWEEHLALDGCFYIDFLGTGYGIDHSHYGALRARDAIVDRFRERCGQRPGIDRQRPDVRVHITLSRGGQTTVSLDLAGDSLHRRGYREAVVAAPLKETLAAALLLKAGWPEIAATGGSLLDPMCGSGTLVIEAAWIAGDQAPGLSRPYWGFNGWLGHRPALWNPLCAEARERAEAGRNHIPPIMASDCDPKAVQATITNARGAGVIDRLSIRHCALDAITAPTGPAGLLITNPPYGERLGDAAEWGPLYRQLGDRLKADFSGWRAAVLTSNPALGKQMGLRAEKTHIFHNGALECRLLRFRVEPDYFVDRQAAASRLHTAILARAAATGAEGFINRLRKNLRHRQRWAEREQVRCYRLYDADLPDYAVAVDRYEQWLHVQEYAPPPTVDASRAQERLEQVLKILPALLELPPEHVFCKTRQRQKGPNQYQKLGDQNRFYEVQEGPARFLVNFTDYLDTGLFLDHRITRRLLSELAFGKRFLNLFGYTGTATVQAALGGATTTTTVDLSATYLDWARRNLTVNRLHGQRHTLVQADCRQWLAQARDRYDLIFLDPPTFSNSKRMAGTFDIQRDYGDLLRQTARLLTADGILIFSTNHRKFRLDQSIFPELQFDDWSHHTLPPDFTRNPKIHRCWRIYRR